MKKFSDISRPTMQNIQEEKKDKYDEGEYDQEGDMAKSDLRSIIANAKRLHDMIDDSANLPEWVQSKITVAEDYISTVANYMTAEMSEGVSDKLRKSHQDLRKKSGLPHPDYYKALGKSYDIEDDKERLAHQSDLKKKFNVKEEVKDEYSRKVIKYLKKKYNKEEVEIVDEGMVGRVISKVINKLHSSNAKRPLPQASDRREYQKPKMEEVELQEGRPSQRHPLEGHDYHKKSNAELIGIAKDAHAAAEAMKGHSPQSENKYRDQANDSATVRYFRQKSGMPDWYKKKYGHVKEEIELEEGLQQTLRKVVPGYAKKQINDKMDREKFGRRDVDRDENYHRYKKVMDKVKKEEVETLEEKNVPTSPEKWAQAKAQAKAKFDVYPSAYANGWASKKYKEMGGGWKSVSEESILESRKAEIIKKIVKSKKTNSDDKFEPNPIMSKDENKGRDNINNK
jgi:hypothetical protein